MVWGITPEEEQVHLRHNAEMGAVTTVWFPWCPVCRKWEAQQGGQ